MTDEGISGDQMDAVEILQSVRDVARMTREFFNQLREEGFDKSDSLRLTGEWLRGLMQQGKA